MYTLLSGLYKYIFQKDEYCILILGLDNAGKTVNEVIFWIFHSWMNSFDSIAHCIIFSAARTLFGYLLCVRLIFSNKFE